VLSYFTGIATKTASPRDKKARMLCGERLYCSCNISVRILFLVKFGDILEQTPYIKEKFIYVTINVGTTFVCRN